MTKDDTKKPQDPKKKSPAEKSTDDTVLFFRKPPKPNPALDVSWFYDEEEFFSEHMDEFDW
ncbi:MAG: hypothetical protein HN715_01635 [Rhodobiaceae bacterium]|jgi:hypothetical protein|nr:hypothetical protein [Rhodobiaceae bacterium]